MLVTSRSFAEYVAFFALDPDRLPRRVLDCSAGTSGFVAGARARGSDAVAVDPAYRQGLDELAETARAGAVGGSRWWPTIATGSPSSGTAHRSVSASCGRTRSRAPRRPARSPGPLRSGRSPLPFADGSFDLAVCSHLLFTWANVFDMAWHEAALREMARVATEVRVFPLVHQGSGEPVGFLGALRERLTHVETGIVTVPYAFQVGADEMLLVSRL